MADTLRSRIRKAWNVFNGKDEETYVPPPNIGVGYGSRPYHNRMKFGNERTIVTSIYNRIAIDVSALDIRHVVLDDEGRYLETKESALNECLTLSANMDQTARSFWIDVVMSMFDEGVVGIVPIETDGNPRYTDSYDIYSMRTCKILEWYPEHVKIRVYDQRTGRRRDTIVEKRNIAIIENPLYAIVNEQNSTMQRLIRKLRLLDSVDDRASSNSLDLIIQLPYTIKSPARKQQAEQRRKDIEDQLANSAYGVAYTDATEKVTQLNRSLDNNLLKQIEYYQNMLYSQLGITNEVLNGTADEKTMLNYQNRTVEPVIAAICDELKRKFLTPTARTQRQSIEFFKDPFRLVPVSDIAEIADKFTRNEIGTPNEIRQVIGWKPAMDPNADQLRNRNLNQSDAQIEDQYGAEPDAQNEEYLDEEIPQKSKSITPDTRISELSAYANE